MVLFESQRLAGLSSYIALHSDLTDTFMGEEHLSDAVVVFNDVCSSMINQRQTFSPPVYSCLNGRFSTVVPTSMDLTHCRCIAMHTRAVLGGARDLHATQVGLSSTKIALEAGKGRALVGNAFLKKSVLNVISTDFDVHEGFWNRISMVQPNSEKQS